VGGAPVFCIGPVRETGIGGSDAFRRARFGSGAGSGWGASSNASSASSSKAPASCAPAANVTAVGGVGTRGPPIGAIPPMGATFGAQSVQTPTCGTRCFLQSPRRQFEQTNVSPCASLRQIRQ
jgi:hypothetical protein